MVTILKIVAGLAALGIICIVLIAVVSGLLASAGAIKKDASSSTDKGQ